MSTALVVTTVLAGVAVLAAAIVVAVRRSSLRIPQAAPEPRRLRVPQAPAVVWAYRVAIALVVIGVIIEVVTLAQALDRLSRGTTILLEAGNTLGSNPADWTTQRINTAASLQNEADSPISAGAQRVTSDPVLIALGYVPLVGDQATALRDLADASARGSSAFVDTLDVARAVDGTRGSQDPPGTRLLKLVAAAGGPWQHTEATLTPAIDALNADLKRPLLPPLASRVRKVNDQFTPVDDLAKVGAVAGRYLPHALGADQPQTYLVLLANPTELRPAGGFVGSLGTVIVSKGAPTKIDVRSEESYFPQMKKHFDVPIALGRYLQEYNNSLEIGDAGWDPDFPTSGKLSEDIFTAAAGPVDGTVSIDPYAISALLAVTGPVDVPGYGAFTSDDFLPKLNFIVNASTAPGSGKQALGPISNAVLNKVLTAPASTWPKLLQVARAQAEARHIQVLFHDPQLAQATSHVHYDGALLPTDNDFLMAVDANVTPSKGDYYVKKSMDVKIEVGASGLNRHQVTLHYQMPPVGDATDQALNPSNNYRDYLRFYLPESATVANFQETLDGKVVGNAPESIAYDHGHAIISAFFIIPRGHEVIVTMTYQVPQAPMAFYQLTMQKQAGMPELPSRVLISYPAGTKEVDTNLTSDMRTSVTW